MAPLLKFDNVTAWLGGMPILHGIDFSIGNEALAIVGRNGVGKTTLCKSLFGMVDRVEGSIRSLTLLMKSLVLVTDLSLPPHIQTTPVATRSQSSG